MLTALRDKDEAALNALMLDKRVMPLPAGLTACVRATGPQGKQIELGGMSERVWVVDAALATVG